MTKTIILLAAAGLSLAACGKTGAGDGAVDNTVVTTNDAGTDTLGGADNVSDSTALPADEGNGALESGNGADAVGNGSGATGNAQ